LHKYAGEVLAVRIEHDEPQDCYGDCQSDAGWIQEKVIQQNVHDYWSKQYQCEGHEPIYQQQRATQDLECRHDKKVMRLKECADELSSQPCRHRSHAEEIQEPV